MGKAIRKLFWAVALVVVFPVAGLSDGGRLLKVVDHHTGQAIAGAVVTLDGETLNPDPQGLFPLTKAEGTVKARAHGYHRAALALPDPLPAEPLEVKLSPLTPKALYLSFYGVGSKALRGPAMKLIEETELNALVIDVKGDRGMIPYRSSVPLAAEVGAQRIITVRDAEGLMALFKEKDVYTIARIVVFKDDLLATARPDLAVKTPAGEPWRDREGLAWVDPFRKDVWDYNIQIAVEAAKLGFDEIQFDYVRFPDSHSPRFSQPSTEEARVKAITGFLQEARAKLAPYNVFTAADIFGYVCWNLNDTDIGQKLEPILSAVDYLSPMLYPSGFQFGIPGYRNPVQNPHEIVYLSLKKAQERTNVSPLRFRPWLQAFKDYAFDRRPFSGKELRDQISAADKFGSQGWMLWNPGNYYSSESLRKELPAGSIGRLAPDPDALIR
jgi:hypothetical protein